MEDQMKFFQLFILILTALFISCNQTEKKDTGNRMDTGTQNTLNVINKFNEAFNRHDVDGIMKLMTEDCIFENTRPVPDGERFVGQEKVRKVWEELFTRSPKARFETEEIFPSGNRCVVRWIYYWEKDGKEGHVRGVDLFGVRDGKVAEKLSYVKG
jgi:ketosteroid isomerase-like protein